MQLALTRRLYISSLFPAGQFAAVSRVARPSTRFLPSVSQFTMSAKKQEPKILGTTESQPEGFKWVRLKKIDWEDETGKKVRNSIGRRTSLSISG